MATEHAIIARAIRSLPDENIQTRDLSSEKNYLSHRRTLVVRIHNGYLRVLHGNGWRERLREEETLPRTEQCAKMDVRQFDSLEDDELHSVELIRRPSVGTVLFFFSAVFSLRFVVRTQVYTVYVEDNAISLKQYFFPSLSLSLVRSSSRIETMMIEVVLVLLLFSVSVLSSFLFVGRKRT